MINTNKERKRRKWERLEMFSRKSEIARNISCKDGLNKGQKYYGPNSSRRYKEEVARTHRRTIQKKILMTQITMMVY